MSYLAVCDGDTIEKIESREEVIAFLQCKALSDMDDYCEDYDIDIEDASPERLGEIAFGAGYESDEIKVYSIDKILENINKVNLDEGEKEELIRSLKSDSLETSLSYYEGLEEVLEYVDEECINY